MRFPEKDPIHQYYYSPYSWGKGGAKKCPSSFLSETALNVGITPQITDF